MFHCLITYHLLLKPKLFLSVGTVEAADGRKIVAQVIVDSISTIDGIDEPNPGGIIAAIIAVELAKGRAMVV